MRTKKQNNNNKTNEKQNQLFFITHLENAIVHTFYISFSSQREFIQNYQKSNRNHHIQQIMIIARKNLDLASFSLSIICFAFQICFLTFVCLLHFLCDVAIDIVLSHFNLYTIPMNKATTTTKKRKTKSTYIQHEHNLQHLTLIH